MKFSGEQEIDLSQETVWKSLRDADVLSSSIPGCESLEKVESEGESYHSVVATRVGPMKARFSGNMEIQDADPPNSYKIVGSGSAGSAGAARGEVDIKLKAIAPGKTLLEFDASVALTGRMAQIGGKMINSTAQAFANEFFENLTKNASAEDGLLQKADEFKVKLGYKRWLIAAILAAIIAWIVIKFFSS